MVFKYNDVCLREVVALPAQIITLPATFTPLIQRLTIFTPSSLQSDGPVSPKSTLFSHNHFTSTVILHNKEEERRGEANKISYNNIIMERLRRRKFSDGFSVLQSLVPNLLPQATQEQIVSGTIQYIRELERDVSGLEKLKDSIYVPGKLEGNSVLSKITNRRSSVDVSVSGGVAFFGIEVDCRRRLVVDILKVFNKYGVEILGANVAVDEQRRKLMVTVTGNVGGGDGGKVVTEIIRRDLLFV